MGQYQLVAPENGLGFMASDAQDVSLRMEVEKIGQKIYHFQLFKCSRYYTQMRLLSKG